MTEDLNALSDTPMNRGPELARTSYYPVIRAPDRALPAVALLGAAPAFEEPLLVGRPNIPDPAAFRARIETILETARLTNAGPMVQEFEQRIAQISGARHAIAMSNGTMALELTIDALGLSGEVIVPSFTFVATVHALVRCGITPVFCDVDPATHCLDPERVAQAVTPRTTGILAVSLWDNLGDPSALRRIARRHDLRLIFDSAHSFGCGPLDGTMAGLCDAEVFSFHATKCIQAVEGGAVVTDDDALAARLRLTANFGFTGEDRIAEIGTNGKMNELEAAMGLTSLDAMDRIFAHNRMLFDAYADSLAGLPGLRMVDRPSGQRHNYHYVPVEVDPDVAGLTRDMIVGALRFENVLSRRYFHPGCHRMEPYRRLFPEAGRGLPVSERLSERVMVLPSGLSVDAGIVHRLGARIAALIARAPEVRAALAVCLDPRLPDFLRPI